MLLLSLALFLNISAIAGDCSQCHCPLALLLAVASAFAGAEAGAFRRLGNLAFAKIFLGEVLDFQVQVNEKVILARVHPSQKTPVGAPIHIVLDPSDCIVLKNQN